MYIGIKYIYFIFQPVINLTVFHLEIQKKNYKKQVSKENYLIVLDKVSKKILERDIENSDR